MLAVSRRALGLRGIKFRRYGVQGQAQHGIDLAGREPDGRYTVVQCKDYQDFTANDLRAAVETFTSGRRPFSAYRLIVATSATTQRTEIAEELAKLQDEHPDLELDLWGAEQINEILRYQADVVAQFWTRETADVFCTGAPLPGVPAPPPDRQEQAEQILIGPLKTGDVTPILREADTKRSEDPAESARLYGELAARLYEAGYRGHSIALRNKQLDALREAELIDDAVQLAAHLAATALHHGDTHEPRMLADLLDRLARDAASAETERAETTKRHARLIRAAVRNVLHPLGDSDYLRAVLTEETAVKPEYQPVLVLLLIEDLLATEPDQLEDLDDLINSAAVQAEGQPIVGVTEDVTIRLRLVRTEYHNIERRELVQAARRHLVSSRHAALISAREARRCCLEGRIEEALESWRDAVHDAIHVGLTDAAADWLYAIRALNVQYGPWTSELDDEHRLAQALRGTGTDRFLDRVRDPHEHAMSALVRQKPIEAALAARRWLIDSVVTGSWANESGALEFLGDLYRDSNEPALAASLYQRAGKTKKLTKLTQTVGDFLLPIGPLRDAPWWVLSSRAELISAQADLIEDGSAEELLGELTDLAARGRAGELTDSPTSALTLQATKSACDLVARGTPAQAIAILDLLASDVPREPNHYRHTDDEHATACVDIARAHPALAMVALTRLFDLADYDTRKALELIASDEVLELLGARSSVDTRIGVSGGHRPLTDDELTTLRGRAIRLAEGGRYLADVVRFHLEPDHSSVRERAEQARDRILSRSEPDPRSVAFGTMLVTDSYLASSLDNDDQKACLVKLLNIAGDPREVAQNRKDALIGARNLVIDEPTEIKHETFSSSKAFVLGDQDGSHLDDEVTGEPHPLSSFKVTMGSASLRGQGLLLAAASATTLEQQEWARDQAIGLLGSDDRSDVSAAVKTINNLPREVAGDVDANLLAVHDHVGVRQLSAVLCMQWADRYRDTAMRLAGDPDFRVRRTLAEAALHAAPESQEAAKAIQRMLAHDPRHSVRVAAAAPKASVQ
jgi:hypothetical protein